jgi:hypothetical protein
MRRLSLLAVFVFLLAAIAWPIGSHGLVRSGQVGKLPPAARQYPLWSQLPTRSFAVLGEGTLRARRWGVYAFRRAGRGRSIPCVEIITLRYRAGMVLLGGDGPMCGNISGRSAIPIFGKSDLNTVDATVIALLVRTDVSALVFRLGDGKVLKFRARQLNPIQARKSKLPQFHYLARALGQLPCFERVEGLGASGEVLFRTPKRPCEAE